MDIKRLTILKFLVLSTVLCVCVTLLLTYLLIIISESFGWSEPYNAESSEVFSVSDGLLTIGLIFPAIETVLIIFLCLLLSQIGCGTKATGLIVTTAFAIIHGFIIPEKFINSFFYFLIFVFSYLHWKKASLFKGVTAAFVPHSIMNSVLVVLIHFFPNKLRGLCCIRL